MCTRDLGIRGVHMQHKRPVSRRPGQDTNLLLTPHVRASAGSAVCKVSGPPPSSTSILAVCTVISSAGKKLVVCLIHLCIISNDSLLQRCLPGLCLEQGTQTVWHSPQCPAPKVYAERSLQHELRLSHLNSTSAAADLAAASNFRKCSRPGKGASASCPRISSKAHEQDHPIAQQDCSS